MFHRLFAKYQVWRGNAIDIGRNNEYPADVLSNMCSNAFLFDGFTCGSMEGFLQSLKESDEQTQRRICLMDGTTARAFGNNKKSTERLWWKGKPMKRGSREIKELVQRAYKALFVQNIDFQTALLTTGGKLIYNTAKPPFGTETIISEHEFCKILMNIRQQSHELILEKLRNVDKFMDTTTARLINYATKLIADIESSCLKQQMNVVSVNSDPTLFPDDYIFCLGLSSADMNMGDKSRGQLWLMETAVSNGRFKYTQPVEFGTTAALKEKLKSKDITSSIRQKLVDGLDVLGNS